jgi:hypothetical protein
LRPVDAPLASARTLNVRDHPVLSLIVKMSLGVMRSNSTSDAGSGNLISTGFSAQLKRLGCGCVDESRRV